VRQSLPFFGEKATQHQGRANLLLFFSWLEGEATCLQTQTYLSKSSGYFLTLPYYGKRKKKRLWHARGNWHSPSPPCRALSSGRPFVYPPSQRRQMPPMRVKSPGAFAASLTSMATARWV
jgi:hypothetical protein